MASRAVNIFNGMMFLCLKAAVEFTTLAPPMKGHPPVKEGALPGLSQMTTIRVAWRTPFSNGLPVTAFNLSIDGGLPTGCFVEVAAVQEQGGQEYTAGLEQ